MDTRAPETWVCRLCGDTAPPGHVAGARCGRDGAVFVCLADLTTHPEDPLLGQVVGGKFAVVGLIGVGGFGAVYRAIQAPVGRVVALKVIRPQLDQASHDQLRARFFREARVVARLTDPATVTLYDYGEEADGRLYMVFEYIDGAPISSLLREGPIAQDRVPGLLFQMLGALAEAHRLGCVHRDLKPGNVMLARNALGEETVKVLDFGIAKVTAVSESEHSLQSSLETREGVVVGTPKYMAPEQARGLEIDARADIYALGCLAYAMVSGRPPFDFLSAVDVLMAQVAQAPKPFPEALGVSPRLAAVIFRALEKDPAARFQSAEEMARALAEFAPGLSMTRELMTARADASGESVKIDTGRVMAAAPPAGVEGGTSREMVAALEETGVQESLPESLAKPPTPLARPRPASGSPRRFVAAGLTLATGASIAWFTASPAGPEAPAAVATAVASHSPPASAAAEPPRPAPPSKEAPSPFARALHHAARGEDAAAGDALLEALAAAEAGGTPGATDALRRRALADPLFQGAMTLPGVAARFVVVAPGPAPRSAATVVAGPRPVARPTAKPGVPAAPPTAPPTAGRLAVPEF